MLKKTIAKHLNYLFSDDNDKLILDFNNAQAKPESIEVTRAVAHRIKSIQLTRDYSNDFILILNEDGIVHDLDTRPKTTNLPMEVEDKTVTENRKDKVIFKKNRLGEISIFKNMGISDSTVVDRMRSAIEKQVTSKEGLKVDDVLEEDFFVSDLRNDGSMIHIELLH
jgi:hypothetical protein